MKAGDVINDKELLVEIINNNIVENSIGVASIKLDAPLDPSSDPVKKILKYYENHPSVIKIKNLLMKALQFLKLILRILIR